MSRQLPSDYVYTVTHRIEFGNWRHSYIVHGRDGAVEFWVRELPGKADDFSCGLEYHSATPTRDRPPDHSWCVAIGYRACWHDGTSLYAEEWLLPFWRETKANDRRDVMLERLVNKYRQRFCGAKEDDAC